MRKRREKGLKVSNFALLLADFKRHHGSDGVKQNEKHDRFRPLVFVWCQERDRKQQKKKKEKKKIDKKLKQSNFQNLNEECILSL